MPNLSPAKRAARWQPAIAEISLPLILGCTLLGLAWLLPGHYLPWTLFQQEACSAAGGLFLCVAALQARAPVRWPALAVVAAAMALVPLGQLALGQIRFVDDAFLSSIYLLAFAVAVCVGASLVEVRLGSQLLEALTGTFVCAAVLCTGVLLYQWLDLPAVGDWIAQLPPGTRPYANIGQPNHASSILALGLAGLLRWYETRRIGPCACALGGLWLAWGIVLTQSRTGAVVVVILGSGCLLLHRRAKLRTPPLAAAISMLVFAALVGLKGPMEELWQQASEATAQALRTEAGTRLTHWRTIADAAWHAPWFGYGWNQVAHAQYEFAQRYPTSGENIAHSHNLALDLVVYNGLPLGGVLLLGLAAWVARTVWRCRDGSGWCLIAALLALLTHAMLEYPLHYAYFLLPAGLLIGLLDDAPAKGAWATHTARSATLWLPTILLTASLAWIGVEYLRAEEALRRLRFANARIGITLAELESPDLVLLQGWKAYHDAALLKPRSGMPPAELALLRDVARRYSYAPALNRYALALALNGEADPARGVLARMCKIYPVFVQAALREMWQEQQSRNPALGEVEFPRCAN